MGEQRTAYKHVHVQENAVYSALNSLQPFPHIMKRVMKGSDENKEKSFFLFYPHTDAGDYNVYFPSVLVVSLSVGTLSSGDKVHSRPWKGHSHSTFTTFIYSSSFSVSISLSTPSSLPPSLCLILSTYLLILSTYLDPHSDRESGLPKSPTHFWKELCCA